MESTESEVEEDLMVLPGELLAKYSHPEPESREAPAIHEVPAIHEALAIHYKFRAIHEVPVIQEVLEVSLTKALRSS